MPGIETTEEKFKYETYKHQELQEKNFTSLAATGISVCGGEEQDVLTARKHRNCVGTKSGTLSTFAF